MKDLKFKVRTVHDRGEDNMNINGYLDYINVPWGRLFYRLVWHNLGFIDAKIKSLFSMLNTCRSTFLFLQ